MGEDGSAGEPRDAGDGGSAESPPDAPRSTPRAPRPTDYTVGVTRQVTPTDVAQFIRLEQCERYLRLRLHQRAGGANFLRDYGVAPQAIPPLLTRSGARFEARIEAAVRARFPAVNLADERAATPGWADDNARVLALARDLAPGATLVLFQARLRVALDGWQVRGDADILRLERDAAGALAVLIADMKSSTAARVEHRLQVAFYHELLERLFRDEGVPHARIATAILYRGPAGGDERRATPPAGDKSDERRTETKDGGTPDAGLSREEAARRERERALAGELFGTREAFLEIVAGEDADAYRAAVRDLVTGPGSVAARVAAAPFETIPFHLTYKCDGCLYNEFCLKRAAERDDLSLLPHLTAQDKGALHGAGLATTRDLALLKDFRFPRAERDRIDAAPVASDEEDEEAGRRLGELVPAPGKEATVRRLAATWPVGPRLDELVHRARRYRRWKRDPAIGADALPFIPSKGYGSLPYADAGHNPNLVRVYLDAQHDYLNDRIYLLGALVAACEGGVEHPDRRRAIVALTDGPPDRAEAEEALFVRWIAETTRAVVELAAPDGAGRPRAPIHLVFSDAFAQRLLLDGLARHFGRILGATPLYDFLTQLAAFDSPVATFLDREIRELKNYPMVCQSLQAVAAYLKFDWNAGTPYRDLFRARMFDFWGKLDWGLGIADCGMEDNGQEAHATGNVPTPQSAIRNPQSSWYTSRARFNSQIPLEYAYAAWGELPDPAQGRRDEFAPYRAATAELLRGFQTRRLEALEHVARDFGGNRQTEKRPFDLPDLAGFAERARTLAGALDEFVTIERHVALGAWKAARLAPPERRVLAGEALLARYHEEDQDPAVAERNRENLRRNELYEEYARRFRAANPDAEGVRLPAEQRAETQWSQAGLRVRLRLDPADLDCDLDEALALTTIREGARLVLAPRTTVDTRLDPAEQRPFTPTPRQLLYGTRADLARIVVERDAGGRAARGWLELDLPEPRGGGWTRGSRGFVFSPIDRPLVPGELYSLDPDPNDWHGYGQMKTVEALRAGAPNTLYARLADPATARVCWPAAAAEGQARFLAGLDALHAAGALHPFEESKRAYIGGHGDAPTLLVQGPPGTGKSYATAFAVLARLQGALAADIPYRVFLSCKTHAATDVLLDNLRAARDRLRELRAAEPAIWAAHFDDRLLDLPLFRARPRGVVPDGVGALPPDDAREPGTPRAVERILAAPRCVVAATPGGVRALLKDRWPNGAGAIFGRDLADALVLDEASQLGLPEALLAALPLKAGGHLIVVGDHRQMPPIVRHDWAGEPRRTFRAYRAYESLFLALLGQEPPPPIVRFEESFRLHADMAAFLRREVYERDGIAYHSRRRATLPPVACADPFVVAALAPEQTIVVVVHEEAGSQLRNPFERDLIAPVLAALADAGGHALGPEEGLGVVVPHRAQRAALQERVPALTRRDPATGAIALSAVDTVERFQGGEREAIVVGATEGDRAYLLRSGEFLLDPRRLTVALSRAKKKLIVVAARSVFELFSADEEAFAHAQLWKNLLRRTCTAKLWEGARDGRRVTVWGNVPPAAPAGEEG